MEICNFNVTLEKSTLDKLMRDAKKLGLPVNEYIARLINRQALLPDVTPDPITGFRHVVNMKRNSVPLSIANPELAEEFDRDKNFPLNPDTIGRTSTRKVWWKCKYCGKEYMQAVGSRVRKPECQYCFNKKEDRL